jgi:hypothetical protein
MINTAGGLDVSRTTILGPADIGNSYSSLCRGMSVFHVIVDLTVI